jgi:hypothetical protein
MHDRDQILPILTIATVFGPANESVSRRIDFGFESISCILNDL